MFFGYFTLWAALVATLGAIGVYVIAALGRRRYTRIGRSVYAASAAIVAAASAYFMWLILANRFEVNYVFENSSSDLPLIYKISAFWAGQQGSFLFWALCVGVLGLLVMRKARSFEPEFMAIWGGVQGILLILLLVDNPFKLLPKEMLSGVTDGYGLRELLQNPWMAIHPPVVFIGYAAMTVPGVFALAALIKGDLGNWRRTALPWALFGWVSLGAGIILGAYWAYEVLGWGGYWGWDPVENASLVPWLTGTALLHAMLAEHYRGSFRKANLILALVSLVCVFDATFLTRTDALKEFSVHTFGGTPVAGWLLWFMRIFMVASIYLLVKRWKEIESGPIYTSIVSRDFALFLAIVLLSASAAWVLAGTSMPIIGKMAGHLPFVKEVASGAPGLMKFLKGQFGPAQEFYSRTNAPIALMILALMALVPVLPWRGKSGRSQAGPGVVIAAVALGIPFISLGLPAVVFAVLAAFVAAAALAALILNARALIRTRTLGMRALGGFAAHVGIGIMFVGIVFAANGGKARTVSIAEGTYAAARLAVLGTPRIMGDYRFAFEGVKNLSQTKVGLKIGVEHDGEVAHAMASTQITKENEILRAPAIVKGLVSDLYISPSCVPVAEQMILAKGTPTKMHDIELTFADFVPPRGGGTSGIGARLHARYKGRTETVLLYLTVKLTGGSPESAVEIPGTNASITVDRIMVEAKAVEVTLIPNGGQPETALLTRGEPADVGGYRLTFKRWVIPEGGHGSDFRIGVAIDVAANGKTVSIQPTYSPDSAPQTRMESRPVAVPGAQLKVALTAADVSGGRVQLDVTPTVAVIDVSVKPCISLVWIGSILALVGGCAAIWRRAAEAKAKEKAEEAESAKAVKRKVKGTR